VGDYRIIYTFNLAQNKIYLLAIGHRREITAICKLEEENAGRQSAGKKDLSESACQTGEVEIGKWDGAVS